MICERCGSFATEHVIVVAPPREMHLCATCAAGDPDLVNDRAAARLNWPGPFRNRNAHDFLHRWVKFRQLHGREPTDAELADILRHLRKDEGGE